ncbi:MAG: type II toxin-antitoxin system RelE/ParE family toxin [Pirellulales bacterium]
MPQTEVLIFAEEDGSAPLLVWLDEQDSKVQDKCQVRIERLAELGHELRRPEADYLREGVYELRIRFRSVNYRILYFFHARGAVLSHGITKERAVPDKEIDRALRNKSLFDQDPDKHTYAE